MFRPCWSGSASERCTPEQAIAALRFDPLLPDWLFAALAAALRAAARARVALWRRARGTLWRLAAFAVLLLWLAGPRLVRGDARRPCPISGCWWSTRPPAMQVGDRARLAEQPRAGIEAQAAGLPDLELRTVTVPEAGTEGTRLFGAIDRALADIPRARLAGIVAITDGQVHDIPAATRRAARRCMC